MECARDVEELIQTSTTGQIAAFIAEPIMGVGGFITPPKDYFKVVTEIVRRYGGIFICDEVQTGWGRTGDHWCGIEHWDVAARGDDLCEGHGQRRADRVHDRDCRKSPTSIPA